MALPVYPNRARELVLTGLDQLWVADITYIRLEWEFVYLAVILDAFSRRVIGWALDRTLEARLALDALRMALAQRRPAPGLVHHSDRGVQYASTDYTDLLKENGVVISMSRRGNPYDNATCESFIKTLKYEEVYRTEYRDLAEARASIGVFLEQVYNQQRLHSALGYLPPAEFEAQLTMQSHGGRCAAACFMSFLRHEEIYRSDVGFGKAGSSRGGLPPTLIGLDEFPVGYSLAGCSPAGPASASPTGGQCAVNSFCRSRIFQRTANSVLTGCLTPGGKLNRHLTRTPPRLGCAFSAIGSHCPDEKSSPAILKKRQHRIRQCPLMKKGTDSHQNLN